ncbi:MAG TPA: hypothetical protein VGM50_04340 [Gemmatimonadaceae bacterium]|jgi:hypothetical protein
MHHFSLRTRTPRGIAPLVAACVLAFSLTLASVHTSRAQQRAARGWRVSTYEHMDLWLHGFAMLTSDTGHVPFFARGYKQEIKALKQQKNIFSQLDASQPELSQRFATNPGLANAQFVAMYFPSFQEIVNATDKLMISSDPRSAADPRLAQEIALLAANFPTPADREWLRKFVAGLQDEDKRFYHAYWTNEQTVRGAAFTEVNQRWVNDWYPKLSRFLNNTQQARGELILSVALGGEGRTVNNGKQDNLIAVGFPRTLQTAPEALFAFVHEAVATLVNEAIKDNTTPAENRSGAAVGYQGNGAVRGGEMLLEHVAPDLVPTYMRYYLATLGRTAPAGDPKATFEATFPLPPAILDATKKMIDVTLGGI